MDDDFISFPSLSSLPFEEHLQNNYLPTPIELEQLQELFQVATAEDASIKERVKVLQDRRAALRSYSRKLATVLAPSRKIPSDVLGVIFGFIAEDYLQLSQVCRRWRDVAITMPSLWTTLPDFGIPVKSVTGFFRCIEDHHSRAGSRPLDIQRLVLPLKTEFTPKKFKKFLSLFQKLIPRIRILNVEVGERWTPVDLSLLAMFPQAYDRLETLCIKFQNADASFTPDEQITIVENSPNLSRVAVTFPMAHNLPPLVEWLNLNWANFSSLELGWITWRDVYAILEHSPRLEKLAVVVDVICDRTPIYPTTKISHPKLRVFYATSNDYNGPALSCFDLPVATSIYLNINDKGYPSDPRVFEELHIQALQNFLPSPTFKHLSRLFLGAQVREDCSGYGLVRILRFTPSVVELCIAWVKNIWVFFAALCNPAPGGGYFLLPSLASLRLCKFPVTCYQDNKMHDIWQTTISQLASQRGNQGETHFSISLAYSTSHLAAISPRKQRHRFIKLLNQAIVLKDMLGPAVDARSYNVGNWEVEREETIRQVAEPTEQILKLANEDKLPQSENDGLVSFIFFSSCAIHSKYLSRLMILGS